MYSWECISTSFCLQSFCFLVFKSVSCRHTETCLVVLFFFFFCCLLVTQHLPQLKAWAEKVTWVRVRTQLHHICAVTFTQVLSPSAPPSLAQRSCCQVASVMSDSVRPHRQQLTRLREGGAHNAHHENPARLT